ncbi:MAG: hydantoinase/oxoprolinase N-terminal domain-containing protein [Candidatus Binatia bacterium]
MRIGIDVGGTNTDAVLMNGPDVLAEVKTSTTADVTSGITAALKGLAARKALAPDQIQAVMIGTTHFTNAVVECRRLMATAALRLGLPATRALRPMAGWPEPLRRAIGDHAYLCHGGHEFDGRAISPLDVGELRRVAEDIRAKGIRSVAITAVFSPVNGDLERQAADVLQREIPGLAVSLSHEIGRIGLLERESATIMNACLRDLAVHITGAFRAALDAFGIDAPVYLSQNDGTLMSVEYAETYPVATFASGPTNSMRGAAFLSGLTDCVVVDIGGTTSDVGLLQRGFPREASLAAEIGGVRTNFRMPAVFSLGIGGGSHVSPDGSSVGPTSVGYELTTKALVFGGDTLTTTDIAVAAGLADIGDRARVAHLPADLIARVIEKIEVAIAQTVDRMKTSKDPIPVVVVGGGSILVQDRLGAERRIVKPNHYAVANAIGAAIAQVGGEVDRIFSLAAMSREDALAEAKAEATEKAIAAGASPASMSIVDIEEVPLAYLPGNAARIRVKAVGDLTFEARETPTRGGGAPIAAQGGRG